MFLRNSARSFAVKDSTLKGECIDRIVRKSFLSMSLWQKLTKFASSRTPLIAVSWTEYVARQANALFNRDLPLKTGVLRCALTVYSGNFILNFGGFLFSIQENFFRKPCNVLMKRILFRQPRFSFQGYHVFLQTYLFFSIVLWNQEFISGHILILKRFLCLLAGENYDTVTKRPHPANNLAKKFF